MLKIGITGGIGSGKSTVCGIFETLGVPVYYADTRAKQLMQQDPALIAALQKHFGAAVFSANGQLDRAYLSGLVFGDAEKVALLNSLVHPVVAADSEAWMAMHHKEPYVLKEAALLFESGSYRALDAIICVTAPLALRLKRVMERDGTSREAVLARIHHQWPQEEKDALADYLIVNDGTQLLLPQVLNIHSALCNRSKGQLD